MTISHEDRRGAVRQVLRTKAQLLFAQGLILDARTLNISATGIAFVADGPIAPGTSFPLRFHVLVNSAPRELVTPVSVAHSVFSNADDGFVVGLVFRGQSPEVARVLGALEASL